MELGREKQGSISCIVFIVKSKQGSKKRSFIVQDQDVQVCVIWEWWLDSSFIDFALSISLFLWDKASIFLASAFVSHLCLTLRERFYTIEHMEHLYFVGWNGMLRAPSVGVARNVVCAILILGLWQKLSLWSTWFDQTQYICKLHTRVVLDIRILALVGISLLMRSE